MSRNARSNKNGKKEKMSANLANNNKINNKMTTLPQSPMRQSTKQGRGPIKVGEVGKYDENDNFPTIGNEARHKAVKGAHKSWQMWPIWQIWQN